MAREKKKIAFRRIRGRIVPIRIKSSNLADAGIASIIGGTVIGLGVNTFVSPVRDVSALKRKIKRDFPSAFKRAGNPQVKRAAAAGSIFTFSKGSPLKRQILGRSIIGPAILTNTDSEAIFLHELGHIISSRKRGSANRKFRKAVAAMDRSITKGKTARSFFRLQAVKFSPINTLKREAEATFEAVKIARTKGRGRALKTGAKLIVPYLSYVGVAAGITLLGAAGVKRIHEGFTKKPAARKKKRNN